jgi:hypothetical protein
MFISKTEKEDIRIQLLSLRGEVSYMRQCLDRLMLPAPWGRCKDGTPRKKPGVKKGAKQ